MVKFTSFFSCIFISILLYSVNVTAIRVSHKRHNLDKSIDKVAVKFTYTCLSVKEKRKGT